MLLRNRAWVGLVVSVIGFAIMTPVLLLGSRVVVDIGGISGGLITMFGGYIFVRRVARVDLG
jgi:hypothetical protein